MREKHFELNRLASVLKNARNKKGLTIIQAAESTKIRLEYLELLESGLSEGLPADVYTKGLLRNYSIFLGLDPKLTVALFRRESTNKSPSKAVTKIESPKKELFNFRFTQEKLLLALFIVLFLAGFIYIASRINSVVKPPILEVTSPIQLSGGNNATYTTDLDTITINGKIEVGSKLKVNDVDFDTRNLSIFQIDSQKLNVGENVFNIKTTNDFGIDNTLSLIVIREDNNQSSEQNEPDDSDLKPTQNENMFVEVIIGPDQANLLIIADGVEIQNKVENPGVKTFVANNSIVIQTPRPNSVRIAINGTEQTINNAELNEWIFIDGNIVKK